MCIVKKRIYQFFIVSFLSICFSLQADTLKEAKKAYASRQYQKAIKLFLEYSKKNPTDGEPYMYIGYMLESQKQYDASMAYFRKAVELNLPAKHKKTCLLKIIIFYNYHRSWELVIHYANKYLKLENNPEIQKIKDKAYANRTSDSTKVVSTNSILTTPEKDTNPTTKPKEKEKSPVKSKTKDKKEKNISLLNKENISSEELKIWEKALQHIDKEEYQLADLELDTLLEMNSKNKNYLYKSGIVKMKLGKYEQALELLESARNLANEKETTFLYFVFLNEGNIYLKNSKIEQALELYKKAYFYNKSPTPLLALSKIYYEKFDYENAYEYASNVLKLENSNIEALMYHGISLVKLGKRILGFASLMKFSELIRKQYIDLTQVPLKYHDGLLYLGVFYANRSKYKLALKYLNLVSKTKSDQTTYHFHLGKTFFYTGQYEKALEEFSKIPQVPAANYLIAKFYASQKNLNKTKEYFLKATKGKEIYWIKVRLDPVFREFMQNPEFQEFIILRGEIPLQPSKTERNLPPTN